MAQGLGNLGNIYADQGDTAQAQQHYQRSKAILQKLGNRQNLAIMHNSIGSIYQERGQHRRALRQYRRGLKMAREMHYLLLAIHIEAKAAASLHALGRREAAIKKLRKTIRLADSLQIKAQAAGARSQLASIYLEQNQLARADRLSASALQTSRETGDVDNTKQASEVRYRVLREQGYYRKALSSYRLYVRMRDSLESLENRRAAIRLKYKYRYEKQALQDSLEFAKKQEVKDLQIARQKAVVERQRLTIALVGGGLVLLGLLAGILMRANRREKAAKAIIHQEKNRAEEARRRSDELLRHILPADVAEELKTKGFARPHLHPDVTILYCDFVGFTRISEQLGPERLVDELNRCFQAFDQITEDFGLEKIKTIGDAYLAVCGLPQPREYHAYHAVRAALAMAAWINDPQNNLLFQVRIGLHSGPVVAGIVGVKKYAYDIWGDTVNTAARMEQHGAPGKVNISQTTFELLPADALPCTFRGKIEAKNKGKVGMYFVHDVKLEVPS